MENLVRSIQNNPLAVTVLVALILSALTSLIFIFGMNPEYLTKSRLSGLLSILAFLGFPAVLDLMYTDGITKIFAILVLGVLVLFLIIPIINIVQKRSSKTLVNWEIWSTPVLVAGGLVVAGYLSYVEITSTNVICGIDIPGCVTVQTSSYARLFGFLPIGIVGIAGYIAIFTLWFLENFVSKFPGRLYGLVFWGCCFFGVIFSTYLTYLEVFVIRATCSWCILSAVFMILLLWVSTPKAQKYLNEN